MVVNLFFRELGFVMTRGNPLRIKGFEDLNRKGVRFINRQAGSGTRILLDNHLEKAGIPPGSIDGYDQEVSTHIEVGLAILSGGADTGIATAAVSSLLGLDFIPVTRERFDMILAQSVFFQKGVQALDGGAQWRACSASGWKICVSYDFRKRRKASIFRKTLEILPAMDRNKESG